MYLIKEAHRRRLGFLLELVRPAMPFARDRILGFFDILRTHAGFGACDPGVRSFDGQKWIELLVIAIEIPVERIVYAGPVQGRSMIVPQVLSIVTVAGYGADVAGRDNFLLHDQGCLAVERTRVRCERCIGRTV